ncbi:unnamed protein product [Trifolium pratense]|uniref:Uncharacterized protein n=1 Tax=Trifolium pratense TaxID=57577 RepID=A0ACB0J493_TRIPR|nr:unnamed protein product [Trifolium pratense]
MFQKSCYQLVGQLHICTFGSPSTVARPLAPLVRPNPLPLVRIIEVGRGRDRDQGRPREPTYSGKGKQPQTQPDRPSDEY